MKNPRILDMTGKIFGSWTVVSKDGNTKGGAALWHCICDCGNSSSITGSDLRNGKSTRCRACSARDRATTHGKSKTRIYSIYKAMKTRCYNKKAASYDRYGGRGIEVCKEWLDSFDSFRLWAESNGYNDLLSIDRIDNNKGYYPSNCRWATHQTQSENRNFVAVAPCGKLWWHIAQENGITSGAYRSRLSAGWPIDKAASYKLNRPLDAEWREKRERGVDGRFI